MIPGDDLVVYVPGFARDQLDTGDAFLFRLVCQHRAGDDVANGVDAFDVGAEMVVHFDPAAVVDGDAEFVRPDPFGEGAPADGDEDFVGFEIQLFASFGGGGDGATVGHLDRADFGFEMKLHPLRGEGALEEVGDFEIEPDCDAGEKFEHRDFGTEPAPDRAKLETDRTRADDEKFFGRFIEAKRFRAADDGDAVEGHAREVDRYASRGDHDMIGGDFGRCAVVRLDLHFARLGDGAEAAKSSDLVAFHEGAHAAGEGFHDLVFARQHGGEVEADLIEDDAVFGGFLFREDEMIARSEERFARDAADVEAGAAEVGVFLDEGGLESELGGTDGADIAARARADDDDVEFIHGKGVAPLSSSAAYDCH